MFKRFAETRQAPKDERNMEKNNTIVMLQYRIQRYQAMGNGSMCQSLISKLKKIQSSQNTMKA